MGVLLNSFFAVFVTLLGFDFVKLGSVTGQHYVQLNLSPGETFDGWTYLGTSRSISRNNYNDSSYFTAKAPFSWLASWNLCNDTFGNDASLVNIESAEEFKHLQTLIAERVDSSFDNFWTDAKYVPMSDAYFWAGNVPLGTWIPWASGEPRIKGDSGRLFMQKVSTGWEMISGNQATQHGFICEVAPRNDTAPPPDCDQKNDLIILLESSRNVTSANFQTALRSIIEQAVAAWMGWPNPRVAFIVNYSQDSGCGDTPIRFPLNNALNDFQRRDLIRATDFKDIDVPQGHCALREAYNHFGSWPTQGSTTLLFLTTGEYPDKTEVQEEAAALRTKTDKIIAMGVTAGVKKADLNLVASDPSFASLTMDFPWLKDKLEPELVPGC